MNVKKMRKQTIKYKPIIESFGPLEYIKCDICGSNDSVPIVSQGHPYAPADKMKIVRCKNCGFMYTNPRPSEKWIEGYNIRNKLDTTPGSKFRYGYEQSVVELSNYINRIKIILQYKQHGKLFDIGCGGGRSTELANSKGFESFGCDIFLSLVIDGRNRGLKLFHGELISLNIESNSLDVITLWTVLEHVRKPTVLLKEIYRVLKPDGFLFIEVPNCELWYMLTRIRLKRVKPFDLIAWTHLNHFTQSSLSKLLRKAGFQKIKYYPINTAYYTNYYTRMRKILFWGKRLLFLLSGGKLNISFPLFAIVRKS